MKAHYYDPMFYICSEEMPFTIRIETTLKEAVDGGALSAAVEKAAARYPYFRIRVIEDQGELLTVPNDLPVVVYNSTEVYPLGGEEVNYHIIAVSYYESRINFFASHVVGDGAGFFPFFKTVLYYYLCGAHDITLDSTGIRLSDEPFFEDEFGNPYPEEKMAVAEPLYSVNHFRVNENGSSSGGDGFFRLRNGGYVNDSKQTVYRFRVNEEEIMHFNYDHDGSPCALVSSLMTKAIWSLHPDITEDIVSAVSFNLRPGLGSAHSYRMLCSYIPLVYPVILRGAETAKLCTCSRGMVTLRSQPENVLWYAERTRRELEAFLQIPDLSTKKELMGRQALEDSIRNTFSVSYVGKVGLGAIEPYLESMYNFTDGATHQSVFIEISAINGWFDIAFIQGFSSNVYYRAFLRQLELDGLSYIEESPESFGTPKMILP